MSAAPVKHVYKFNVKMNCSGCQGAVERVLSKMDDVSSFEIDFPKQEVLVRATASYDDVHAKLKKTGKEVLGGETIS